MSDLLPVGTEVLHMVLYGPPRTKKNSQQIIEVGRRCPVCRRGKFSKVIPSAAYLAWAGQAVEDIRKHYAKLKLSPPGLRQTLNLEATYFRQRRSGDLINFHEALCDVLEDAGVVDDDRWIVSTNGSLLDHSAAEPRVVFTLTVTEDTGHAVAGL